MRLILGVLCSLAWRPVGGFLLAAFGGAFVLFQLQAMFFGSAHLPAANALQQAWVSSLALLAAFLWVIALYSSIRFGLWDAMTWMSASFALPATVAVCFWWQQWMPSLAVGAVIAFLISAMFFRKGRLGVAAVAATVAIEAFVWMIGLTLSMTLLATGAKRLGFTESTVKTTLEIWLPASYLFLTWLICAACVRIHRLVLEGHGTASCFSPDEIHS
ncbi:MAG: hypothetical protein ABI286_00300 [Edaphobacter sp.]